MKPSELLATTDKISDILDRQSAAVIAGNLNAQRLNELQAGRIFLKLLSVNPSELWSAFVKSCDTDELTTGLATLRLIMSAKTYQDTISLTN